MFDLLPMLILGLGLGLIHALDADHIMAMSVLNSNEPEFRNSLFYSVYWALEHSVMVLSVAMLFFAFEVTVPDYMNHIAERCVGMMTSTLQKK